MQGKYVITGGSGTGKTTLVDALQTRGFSTIPESSREFIEELKRKDPGKLPWKNRLAFQELIVARRTEDYLTAPTIGPVFFDRGLPDEIAFYIKDGFKPSEECLHACETYRYDKIFFLPSWGAIFENDCVRAESFNESVRVQDIIKQAYKSQRYFCIEVPHLPVEGRIDFILSNI
ncbi:AAA family ATPase [Nanoarchaeota archaeon]